MKKIFSFLVVFTMAFSVAGCFWGDDKEEKQVFSEEESLVVLEDAFTKFDEESQITVVVNIESSEEGSSESLNSSVTYKRILDEDDSILYKKTDDGVNTHKSWFIYDEGQYLELRDNDGSKTTDTNLTEEDFIERLEKVGELYNIADIINEVIEEEEEYTLDGKKNPQENTFIYLKGSEQENYEPSIEVEIEDGYIKYALASTVEGGVTTTYNFTYQKTTSIPPADPSDFAIF